MSSEVAASAVSSVLMPESLTSISVLPSLSVKNEQGVVALDAQAPSPCVQVTINSANSQTWTFNCTNADGGTITGSVGLNFTPQNLSLNYDNLRWTKASQSWSLNGTRNLQRVPNSKQATLSYSNFSVSFADTAAPANNSTYTITGTGTLDASQADSIQLYGQWTLTESGKIRTVLVTQPQALTWSQGCCWPIRGVATVTEGNLHATVTCISPCGTLSIQSGPLSPFTRSLPGCPA